MISNRDLETLRQVASLGELLRDPGKFVSLVSEAQESVKQLTELLAANATVQQADQYLTKARTEVGTAQEKVSAARVEQQRILEETQRLKAVHDAKIGEDQRFVNEGKQALLAAQASYGKLKEALDQKQVAWDILDARLQEREQKLVAQEQAQRERADQISKLARAT